MINDKTVAVMLEPIQGEGGIHQAKEEWLRALRKRCNDVGAVLMFDEIQVCRKHPLIVPETKLDPVRVVPFGDTLGAFASSGGLPS